MADRVRRRRRGEDFSAWFWGQVRIGPGCWTWPGATNSWGYGVVRNETGVLEQAHRIAFRLARSPVPPGRKVLHHCDNPPCCRPSDLFVGDHAANMRDAAAKGRMTIAGRGRTRGADGRLTSDVSPHTRLDSCPVAGCRARFPSRPHRLERHVARPHWRCSCGAIGVDWPAHVRRNRRRGAVDVEHVRSRA